MQDHAVEVWDSSYYRTAGPTESCSPACSTLLSAALAWRDRAPQWGIRWENVKILDCSAQSLCINNFQHSCFSPWSWQVITSCRMHWGGGRWLGCVQNITGEQWRSWCVCIKGAETRGSDRPQIRWPGPVRPGHAAVFVDSCQRRTRMCNATRRRVFLQGPLGIMIVCMDPPSQAY